MKERFIEPCDGSFECPATAAGYDPSESDLSSPVANAYDEIVNQRGAIGIGLLSEEDAREAWLDAIAGFRYGMGRDVKLVHHLPNPKDRALRPERFVEAREAVARELGWLKDGESVPASEVSE